MKKSSVFVARVFTSLFLVLYIFIQPLLAIETLIPGDEFVDTSATALLEESLPIDTEESILEEGISDPAEIAKEEVIQIEEVVVEEVKTEETPIVLPIWNISEDSSTTSLPVVINQAYVYPLNTDVTVTFTQLPEVTSTLTIKTISLTTGEMTATGAVSNIAYDITTDMVDGTFEYDLTLPSRGENTTVIYAENRVDLLSGGTLIDNLITEEKNVLTIDKLDHFTVFVVTTNIPPLSDTTTPTCVEAGATSNSGCYNNIQSAINAASNGDKINVSAGIYEISTAININKEIELVGPNSGIAKIIQTSNPAVSVFSISSSNVTLDNFEITNEQNFPENHLEVTNALISIPNNANISNVTISNNNIYSNYAPGTLQKDMYTRGITVGDNATTGISVTDNTISNVRNGIVIRPNNTSVTSDNTIFNTKGGIMHYTSSFVDAANRIMTGNDWTNIHNEWDIVWNSATYGFPDYQESIIQTSAANNGAYTLDIRRDISTSPSNLTENRSPVFVTNTGLDKIHQSSGNLAEPFATLQYAIDTVTPGGTIYLLSDLDITSEVIIDKPVTIEGNNHIIFSKFTKTDNSNNSGIGIHSDNVTIKNLTVDAQYGSNLHGINAYVVKNILLDNLTLLNNNAGIVVNGSIVTVKDVTTFGNSWGGINVDLGGGVTSEAKLTVEGMSSHSENFNIWIDDYREAATVVDIENQYDYLDFGYTRVYRLKMTSPEILGWNVKNSPTDTPSTPRPSTELSCGSLTNINGASSHWTDVSGGDSNIKYERQYRYDLGSGWTNWAGSEIYSNPYTNFRVFGSNIGNQGTYDTRVRAFYDINENNKSDSTEFHSDWSNGCIITFDNTGPSAPEIIFPNPEQYFNTQPILNDWNTVEDFSGIAHYRIEYDYDDHHTFSGAPYRTTTDTQRNHTPGTWEQGGVNFRVQAFDNAGNEGAWSESRHYFYDITPPEIPSGIYFRDTDNNKDVLCNQFTNTKHLNVHWNAITDDPSFSHFEYSSFDAPNGSAGLVEKVFTANHFNSSWWTIPMEGTYGVQLRSVDKAGNKSAWFGGIVGIDNSCQFKVDWIAPDVTTTGIKYPNNTVVNKFVTTYNTPIIVGQILSNDTASVKLTINSHTYDAIINGNDWEANVTDVIPNGTYEMQIEATDNVGNSKMTTQAIVIDSLVPSAAFTHYKDGVEILGTQAFVKNISQLSFTGEYVDPTPSSELYWDSFVIFQAQDDGSFAFSQNGKLSYCSWRQEPNLVILSGNPFILTTQRQFTDCVATLPEGTYYMTHQIYDNATRKDIPTINQFKDVLGLKFTVDTTAPTKPLITNTPNNAFTNVNAITINWTGGDDTVDLNNTEAGISAYSIRYVFTPANGSADIDWSSNWVQSGNPHTRSGSFGHGEGKYVIYVKTIDLAGNESPESDPYTITYDKTDPVTTATGIDSLWHNTDVTVILTCEDINGGGCYKTYYSLNGGAEQEGDTVIVSTEGLNTIKFYSVDNAGNIENEKTSDVVKIDKTNPTGNIFSFSTYVIGEAPTTVLTLTDNNTLAKVCYSLDGVVKPCVDISGLTFSWNITSIINALPVGSPHTFAYTVEDTAGNKSDSNASLEGSDAYSASFAVTPVPTQPTAGQIQGVTTQRTILTNEEDPEENTTAEDTEELLLVDTQENEDDNGEVLAEEDQQDEKAPFPWWGYLLIAALLSFIIFILSRRRKDEKEQGYIN